MAINFDNKDFLDFWDKFSKEKFVQVMDEADKMTQPFREANPSDPAFLGNQIASVSFNIAFGLLREYHLWLTSPSEKQQL